MDDRTTEVLEALDPVGASLLLELLAGPATEAELINAIDGLGQSTANRRLSKLARAGFVEQAPGKPRATGRQWRTIHPDVTSALLSAVLDVADAVDVRQKARRNAARARLERGSRERANLRVVR